MVTSHANVLEQGTRNALGHKHDRRFIVMEDLAAVTFNEITGMQSTIKKAKNDY